MSTPTETNKPAGHYDLLKLKAFESDQAVIRKHYHKLMEQVRAALAKDPNSAKWQKTADDLTKAMLVLSDARRKSDYDISLGGAGKSDHKLHDLDKIVRARKVLDDTALDKAKKFADTVNLDLHEAIINQKLAPPETIMPLYADSIGIPYVDLADLRIDEALIQTVPAVMARQHSLTPVLRDEKSIVIASPRPLKPEIEEQLRLRFDAQIRQVICTKAAIDEAIAKYYPREAAVAQMNYVPKASASSAADAGDAKAGRSPSKAINKVELRKKKRKVAMAAGFFTFMVCTFVGMFMGWTLVEGGMIKTYLGAGACGGIAAALGYLIVNE